MVGREVRRRLAAQESPRGAFAEASAMRLRGGAVCTLRCGSAGLLFNTLVILNRGEASVRDLTWTYGAVWLGGTLLVHAVCDRPVYFIVVAE